MGEEIGDLQRLIGRYLKGEFQDGAALLPQFGAHRQFAGVSGVSACQCGIESIAGLRLGYLLKGGIRGKAAFALCAGKQCDQGIRHQRGQGLKLSRIAGGRKRRYHGDHGSAASGGAYFSGEGSGQAARQGVHLRHHGVAAEHGGVAEHQCVIGRILGHQVEPHLVLDGDQRALHQEGRRIRGGAGGILQSGIRLKARGSQSNPTIVKERRAEEARQESANGLQCG